VKNGFRVATPSAPPRVLVILPYGPNRIRVRAAGALRELTGIAEVDLVSLDDGNPWELQVEVRKHTVIPNASQVARAFRVLRGIIRGKPIAQEFYNSGRLREALAEIDLRQYDAVYVQRLPVYRYLKHPRLIYDCEDCCSYLDRLMVKHGKGYMRLLYALDAILLPRHERAACNSASLVLVTADREVRKLRELGVTSPIEVWINDPGLDVVPRTLVERARFVISFHGKLSYVANMLALDILNKVIAPALDPSRYDLRIIGKCPPRFRRKFPNLRFTGFVPSIMESVRDSDLCVFPLPVSVGFPNKTVESLAAGVPFICTPGVIDGLPPSPEIMDAGIYVRDISQFLAEIERYRGLDISERQGISRRCRDYAQRLYDSPSRKGQWGRILRPSGR
jgi:glycosyltransferase involved in cell wall biosynthesis